MRRYLVALVACVAVAACSPSTDVPAAENAIAAFHADLNGGNFEKIYDGSDAEMKAETSKEMLGKILAAVH